MTEFKQWEKSSPAQREKQRVKNEWVNDYVKELVMRYQTTGELDEFEMVLFHTDKLVLKLVHKFIRKMPHLKRLDLQEIYNTAILGLYDAVKQMPKGMDPNLMPSKISSYIQSQLKQHFSHLKREVLIDDSQGLKAYCDRISVDYGVDQYLMFDLKEFYAKKIITGLEYRTIRDHVYGGLRTSEIARREGVGQWAISKRITKAVGKMHDVVKRGNLNRMVCYSKLPRRKKGESNAGKDL